MARSGRPLSCNFSMEWVTPNSAAIAISRAALPAPPLEINVPSMSNKQTCMNAFLCPIKFFSREPRRQGSRGLRLNKVLKFDPRAQHRQEFC